MNEQIDLKTALIEFKKEGLQIKYHTLYQWAVRGISINDKSIIIAKQVSGKWYILKETMSAIITAIQKGDRIRVQPSLFKKNTHETRGRKTGTKFGNYRGRGDMDSNGIRHP